MPTGTELITAERERQVTVEGWSAEHDDEHRSGELAAAACCYAEQGYRSSGRDTPPASWPWEKKWWKPTDDRIRNLTIAGALIAAEIDRLQRVCKTCNGWGTVPVECTCYEIIGGGHQMGCPFYGLSARQIGEMSRKPIPCPDCTPRQIDFEP